MSSVSVARSHRMPADARTTASLSATSSTSECPACAAIKKSGKLSCCARGGAWFKNCGDDAGTDLDHTWAEGIQACKGFADSVSVISPLRVMPRHPLNDSDKQTNAHRAASMPDAGIQGCAECFGIANTIVCIYVYAIVFYMQLWFHFS